MTVSWKTLWCLANSFTFKLASKVCDCSFLKPLPRVDTYHMPTDIRRRIALSLKQTRGSGSDPSATKQPVQLSRRPKPIKSRRTLRSCKVWANLLILWRCSSPKVPHLFFLGGGELTYWYLWTYESLHPIYYSGYPNHFPLPLQAPWCLKRTWATPPRRWWHPWVPKGGEWLVAALGACCSKYQGASVVSPDLGVSNLQRYSPPTKNNVPNGRPYQRRMIG